MKAYDTYYSKPYPTIGDLIKKKNYDYVSYRMKLNTGDDIFAGCFKSKTGKIISLDGDVYSLGEKVIASEEWKNAEEGIKRGLTVLVEED